MRRTLVLTIVMLLMPRNSLATGSGTARTAFPAAIYFQEGFDAGTLPSGWTVQQLVGSIATWSVTGTGTNPSVAPFRGAGQLRFNSYDAPSGDQARLVSPAIDLSTASDPYVSFYMYHDDEFIDDVDSVYVEVSTVDSVQGPWWITLYAVARPHVSPGWAEEAISLIAAKGFRRVFLALRGVSRFGNNIYIDDLRIADSSFHDIGAMAIKENGPAGSSFPIHELQAASRRNSSGLQKVFQNHLNPVVVSALDRQPLDLSVIVQNFGTFDEQSYEVRWDIDGVNQGFVSNADTLVRGGRDTLFLALSGASPGYHLLTAWTSLASDSNARNDTARLSIQVLDSAVVFYESFNGAQFPPAGWSTVNRDAGQLPPWFRGASNSVFPPYEGAGFAGDNFQRANVNYLDDYLVSPPIQGVGLTANYDSVVFWTRSASYPPPTANYPDSLMILLSTSGADTGSFLTVLGYLSVPKTGWERQGYRLTGKVPENSTVRVAFRYLLFGAGTNGPSADFIGLDAVQLRRGIPTSVSGGEVPLAFGLAQNYPNPFNPTTTIAFSLPKRELIQVRVFDLLGKEIALLVKGIQEEGKHTVMWDARGLPSGVYFCRLQGSGAIQTIKMLLLR